MNRARSAPVLIAPAIDPPPLLVNTSSSLPAPPLFMPSPPASEELLQALAHEQQTCRRELLESMLRLKKLEEENARLLQTIEEIRVKKQSAIDRLTEVQAYVKVPAHGPQDEKKSAPVEVELSDDKVQKLLNHMKDSKTGIQVKDRWWRLRMYPGCFVGSEMVDWLIAAGWARTREDSKAIGAFLAKKDYIYHSMKDNVFEDGYFYYRFKETAPERKKDKLWCFGPLVKHFSVGLSARLATKIENAEDDVYRLQALKELRQNVLYLSTKTKTPSGWNLRRSRNGVDTYLMDKTLRDPFTKQRYNSRIVKTVGLVDVSPEKFIEEFVDFKTRKRWESLFSDARIVTRLGAATRIIYRSSTSPLKSIWARDVCVLQDQFVDPEEGTNVVYEISVEHQEVPQITGFVRAEVLMIAHVLRAIPGKADQAELTLISQVDFKGNNAPESFVDQWIGLDAFGGTKEPAAAVPLSLSDLNLSFPNVLVDRYATDEKQPLGQVSSVGHKDFEPLSVLGRGAYSKIMQVRLRSTGAVYAMKVLRKADVIQSKHVQHVMTERNILTHMDHPFVVRLYFSFQTQSKLYMIMSYAAGGDLFTYLRRKGLAENVAAFYTGELVLGLRHIHHHKIAHRDVKPENILFGEDGHILLADFGLSKENMTGDKRTFSLSGTSEYLAPEMILNKGHSKEVDWWQLGIVIHEMLTGKHPFYSQNPYRMHQNILTRDAVLDPRLSPEAKSLLAGFFVKDPTRRLGSRKGDIEGHAFFRKHKIDWGLLLQKKLMDPPFKPVLKDQNDVSHFEEIFTREKPLLTPSPSPNPLLPKDSIQTDASEVNSELASAAASEASEVETASTAAAASGGVFSVGGISSATSDEEDPFDERTGRPPGDSKHKIVTTASGGTTNETGTGTSSTATSTTAEAGPIPQSSSSLTEGDTIDLRSEEEKRNLQLPKKKEGKVKKKKAKKAKKSKTGKLKPAVLTGTGSDVGQSNGTKPDEHERRVKDAFSGFSYDGKPKVLTPDQT